MLSSYDRSGLCSISKDFEVLAIEVSKQCSKYPQYYDDASAIGDLMLEYECSGLSSNIDEIVLHIFRGHDYHLVVRCKDYFFVEELRLACKFAFVPMIELCLEFGHKHIVEGYEGACESGDLSVVKMLFDCRNVKESYESYVLEIKNQTWCLFDDLWHHLYYCAGLGGNEKIVQFIHNYDDKDYIKKYMNGENNNYAKNYSSEVPNTESELVCEHTSSELIYNVDYCLEDLDCVFDGACEGGHLNLVKWATERGICDFTEGFCSACGKGHLDIVKYLISYYEYGTSKNKLIGCFCEAFDSAFEGGYTNIIDCVIEWCLQNDCIEEINWSWFLSSACMIKNNHYTKLAIQYGASECMCDKSMQSHLQ